jgi:uncharacterized membrane protein
MAMLIIGLVVFLGVHGFTTLRPVRAAVISRLGETPYKGLYSLAALAGLVLIIWGFSRYRAAGEIVLWTPPPGLRHITIVLMWFAFVALASIGPAPSRIRGWLRHPMLVAVKIWALAHLLANGDLGSVLLFAAFLGWAVFDRIAVRRRGDPGAARMGHFTRADGVAVVVGTVAYGTMIALHPFLIGVPVIGG